MSPVYLTDRALDLGDAGHRRVFPTNEARELPRTRENGYRASSKLNRVGAVHDQENLIIIARVGATQSMNK